jgi:hypothetical protein
MGLRLGFENFLILVHFEDHFRQDFCEFKQILNKPTKSSNKKYFQNAPTGGAYINKSLK